MSETSPTPQPPYLVMASALQNPDVLAVAELAAMRVASMVATAQGGPIPGLDFPEGEPAPSLPAEIITARMALARRVVARQIPQSVLAIGLMQAPDVAMALASDPGNAPTALVTTDLAAAWARNWTDYAHLMALGV